MGLGPIYLADNRALVTLRTGEVVCVDTSSIDAIGYLLGNTESCDLQVFRRFLTGGSIVIDVGANFGLFTSVAAKAVQRFGRLFSIEANPHTFECLRRSVYANVGNTNPRIVLKNAAASDQSGKMLLRFFQEALGGATIVRASPLRANEQRVEVDSIILDELVPADLPVDLVKIDVEGSEPAVLRGMERIIKRSPKIRIIAEYIDRFIAQTTRPEAMLDYVRSFGFAVCLIRPDATLELIAPTDAPPSNCYLLFTRTPDSDLRPNVFEISPYDLRYPERYKMGDHYLLVDNATRALHYDRRLHSAIDSDALSFGPYISLPAGTYEVAFRGEIKGQIVVRITHNFGYSLIRECVVSDFEHPITISLPENVANFEMVLYRTIDLDRLDIKSILLSRDINS
jgi:FkbM family methyltransferase